VEATKEEQQKAQKNNEPLEKIAKALRELQDGLRGRYRNQHPKGDKATEADLRQSFPEYCRRADEILVEVAEAESKLVKLPTIRALYDQDAAPPVTHILKRGDPLKPGDPVEPGVPAVIDDPEKPFRVPVPDKDAKTTGRRRAFAEWVTSEENPLAARVFVNKVWAAYFGTGIVATLDNFGRSGMAPSHPELLDWLATEFMRQGWSMKKLHRLIVTSTAYRQASALRNEAFAADPDNRLLWRMSPRRLDAEPVRDGVLSAAGTLNPAMYGDPVAATTKKSGEVSPQGEALDGRRSVYQIVRRSAPQNFLNAFDAPVMEINCTRRARSTTATQALAMMNGDFISAQAAHFAHRLTEERLTEADALRRAFVIAYGRAPSAQEIDLSASFLARQAKHYSGKPEAERTERSLADLCQVLLASNEFVYLD
jgi:hypothetical protein